MEEYCCLHLKYGNVYLRAKDGIVQEAIWSGSNMDTYKYDPSYSDENLGIKGNETTLDELKDYDLSKQDSEFPYYEYVFKANHNEKKLAKIHKLVLPDDNKEVTSSHIHKALQIAKSIDDCIIYGSPANFNGSTENNFSFGIPEGYSDKETFKTKGKSYLTFALEGIVNAVNSKNYSPEILEQVKEIADKRIVDFKSNYESVPSSDNKKYIEDLVENKKDIMQRIEKLKPKRSDKNLNAPNSESPRMVKASLSRL